MRPMRVIILGGGPAGLSAAYYLRLNGVAATVFDAMPKAGGMIRYGIPEYRRRRYSEAGPGDSRRVWPPPPHPPLRPTSLSDFRQK